MLTISIHQPAYLPWAGYFDKIRKADVFIYLDSVQYEKNSFINRNKIKTSQGPMWLTIPVKTKGHTEETLRNTEIDARTQWRQKHLKALIMNYGKAPLFEYYYPKLSEIINLPDLMLSDYLYKHLCFWCKELSISTKVVRSSSLSLSSKKSDLILELCDLFGAVCYYSGLHGKDYINEKHFNDRGISVRYQAYAQPRYRQLWGEFVPNLSIVDALMNGDCQER